MSSKSPVQAANPNSASESSTDCHLLFIFFMVAAL